MKLKSEEVFWPQLDGDARCRLGKLEADKKCDVAIIGGGITGALCAYHFIRAGVSTVLVDRRQPGLGSTAASTGLLQYEIDTPLVQLAEKLGRDHATTAYLASLESVLAFEPLVEELADRCGLVRRSSVYLASDDKVVDSLRAECEARKSIGIDVAFLDSNALRDQCNLSRPAALRSSVAYEVDPFRLNSQLIRWSVERGLEAFGETEIVRQTPHATGVALHASNGARIDARKVIFATGYEAAPHVPAGLFHLFSTYAMVSEPIGQFDNWPGRFLIWESARPYLYLRTTEDDRVIIGGEDVDIVDPHARDTLLRAKAAKLCERFSTVFPSIDIEQSTAWAGTFAQTNDGLPFIGSLPQFPNAYFALGYGGNGITFGLMAARIILSMFLGNENPYAKLFRFDR